MVPPFGATMAKFPTIYPTVAKIIEPHTRHTGTFIGCRPMGVTVHYTADRNMDRARASDEARDLGYHLVIDRDGKIYQTAYLDRTVNHAGPSMWQEMNCNKYFAAVAVVAWGELKDGKSWAGTSDVTPVKRPYNCATKMSMWDDTTQEQQTALLQVLRWFIACGIDPKNICGHDEAAIPPGRKVDPGGSIPWTMKDLRQMLAGNLA